MFCVSHKIRNTVNPEKLRAEIRKQLFIIIDFGCFKVDKLLIDPHMRVDK